MELRDIDTRRAALTDFQRNLVVIAGAGTGKTSLLVGRLAFALVRLHLEPHQLLALTFTDNAVAEMRHRLVRLLRAVEPWLAGEPIEHGSDAHTLELLDFGPEDRSRVASVLDASEHLPIHTFHGFCSGFLRQHARRLGLPPEQRIADGEHKRKRYHEAFLDFLREQRPDAIHPALERYAADELRDLGKALLTLPGDALAKVLADPGGVDFAALRARFCDVLTTYPAALPAFRAKLQMAIDACVAFETGAEPPPRSEFVKGFGRPGAKVPAELRDQVADQCNADFAALQAYGLADHAGIALALDFLTPFLDRYRDDTARRGEPTFDDLILWTRDHLRNDARLRAEAGQNLAAILVDEFQDTDPLQYDIVFLLAAAAAAEGHIERPLDVPLRPATLFIVGDPKQSIYRFRKADIAAFGQAARRVVEHGGAELDLICNFRSAPQILDFVNHVGERALQADPPYQLGYVPVLAVPHDDLAAGAVEVVCPEELDEGARAEARRDAEGTLTVALIERYHALGIQYGKIAVLLRSATDTSWLLRPLRASGIPYVLEKSRRFYRRHEVVVATALLIALARPGDQVAVLAVLRSAFCAASDRAIFAFVKLHGTTALDYRSLRDTDDANLVPEGDAATADQLEPVIDALRRLLALHDRLHTMPLEAALRHFFDLDFWTIAEGSGYEGAQRLANLARLYDSLLRAPTPLDLAAVAARAESRAAQETEEEESPLFDGESQAVRIMTVHASKGLEFDAVIVPDLARDPDPTRSAKAGVDRNFLRDGEEIVGLKLGASRNLASFRAETERKAHDRAERRRLLYVAATRAKTRLGLIVARSCKRGTWQEDLESAAPLPAAVQSLELAGSTTRAESSADVRSDVAATLAAWRAHATVLERLCPRPIAPSAATTMPSDGAVDALDSIDVAASEAARQSDPTALGATNETGVSDAGRELGIAVHRYLAMVALDRGAVRGEAPFGEALLDEALLDAICGSDTASRSLALPIVAAFHASTLAKRIAHADRALREVPVAYTDDSGRVAHGVIDLLLAEGERWTVVDYKTEHVAADPRTDAWIAAAERHRAQLARYGAGVRRALGLATDPACAIWFARADRWVDLELRSFAETAETPRPSGLDSGARS